MKHQITIQLELPLEHIYQMTLLTIQKLHAAKKAIPNIPRMIQIDIDLNRQRSKPRKLNRAVIGGIVSAVIIGVCYIASYWF